MRCFGSGLTARPAATSPDGHVAYAVVQFAGRVNSIPDSTIDRVETLARVGVARSGLDFQLTGTPIGPGRSSLDRTLFRVIMRL